MYFQLFFTFFRIGLFTFGGGYAMIPFLEKMVIKEKGWIDDHELMEIVAISQMTPGVIIINAATFVGKKQKGILGGVLTSIGVTLPSIIILSLIFVLFPDGLSGENPKLMGFLQGVRAVVIAMILKSFVKLFRSNLKSILVISIFIFTACALFFKILSPIWLIVIGGCLGPAIYFISPKSIK